MRRHKLVFIHGMGDDSPAVEFDHLWSGLRAAYDDRQGHGSFAARFEKIGVEWHQETTRGLTRIFRDAFDSEPRELGWSTLLQPVMSLRTFMTFFLGDVVAYVTEHDNRIRRTVWHQLRARVADGQPFSIIAHSLGSVIAFDFLFNLFVQDEPFDPVPGKEQVVDAFKAQFRGLYTLGSPIGLFMLRYGDLWQRNQDPFDEILNPLEKRRHTWLNFWDEQDVIAYPLERLFGRNDANRDRPLQDVKVCTGIEPVSAHLGYWDDAAVARRIAETLAAGAF